MERLAVEKILDVFFESESASGEVLALVLMWLKTVTKFLDKNVHRDTFINYL